MDSPVKTAPLETALEGLESVDHREYAAYLRRLGKNGVQCRIDTQRHRVVTEYSLDEVVVARSVCRQTPLGRIVEAHYGILPVPRP